MSPDKLTLLILIVIVFLLIYGIFTMIVNRPSIGNFASLTVYHDLQTKDKQEAVEMVIEKKAGNKFEAQASGKGKPNRRT